MKTNNSDWLIAAGIGIGVITSVVIYLYFTKRSATRTIKKIGDTSSTIITRFLTKVIDEQYRDFLAYQLYLLAVDKDVNKESMEELWEKYGKVLSPPVIDWPNLISQLDNDGIAYLEPTVKQFIAESGHISPRSKDYTDLFDEYLIDKARKEAQEKIYEFTS